MAARQRVRALPIFVEARARVAEVSRERTMLRHKHTHTKMCMIIEAGACNAYICIESGCQCLLWLP
jgi:hypothetical protein